MRAKLSCLFLCVVSCLLLFAVLGFAQTPAEPITQGFSFGVGTSSPNVNPFGWGAYDHQIADTKNYVYTGYDAIPYKDTLGQYHIRFQAFAGALRNMMQKGNLGVWVGGSGGVSTNGDATTGLGRFEGGFTYNLGKGFSALAFGQGTYTPNMGLDGTFRTGIRLGFK
jgi:hypothetical protein